MFVAVVATACSGGDEGAGATTAPVTSAPVTTTTPTTTAPTTIPLTLPPLTTTTAAPTTPAPVTTAPITAPPSDLRTEIEADLNEALDAFIAAGADPGSPASQDTLRQYFSGTALDSNLEFFADLAEEGLAVDRNPDVAGFLTLLSDPVPAPDGSAVEFDLCFIDAARIVTPPATPGGQPIVFNDAVLRTTTRSRAVLQGDRWVLDGGVKTQEDEPGVKSCG